MCDCWYCCYYYYCYCTVAGEYTLWQAAEHYLHSFFLLLALTRIADYFSHAVPIPWRRSRQRADLRRRIDINNVDSWLPIAGDEITGLTLPSLFSSPHQKELHVHLAAFFCALLVSCSASRGLRISVQRLLESADSFQVVSVLIV